MTRDSHPNPRLAKPALPPVLGLAEPVGTCWGWQRRWAQVGTKFPAPSGASLAPRAPSLMTSWGLGSWLARHPHRLSPPHPHG